ncbi:hypothetical protein [Tenacibaculum sp. C7A-26P2]
MNEIISIFFNVGINYHLISFMPDLKKDNDYTLRENEIFRSCKIIGM